MKGFTLVELLVVMGLILMVSGGSIAGYSNFNETQKVKQSAITVKNNLRLVQNKAQSGQKPTGLSCSTLVSYKVTFDAVAGSYSWQANCRPEGPVGEIGSGKLLPGVSFAAVPEAVNFFVLTQGADANTIISVKGLSKQYSLELSSGGDITERGFE